MMFTAISGYALTAIGTLAILAGVLNPTISSGSHVDMPDVGIIPITSSLTTGHIL